MIETLTVITLGVLFLVFFRPGKTPPLANPLVIERVGKYRITLAPHLNLAQPLVELIAKRIAAAHAGALDDKTYFFEVRDKQVVPKGFDCYLLSVRQENGILYFEAMPQMAGSSSGSPVARSDVLEKIAHEVAVEQGINISLKTA